MLDWKWFIQNNKKIIGNLLHFKLFLAAKCHNHVLPSSSFHWSRLGIILCNIVRLHHWQLIFSLWHLELDAFQKNYKTLENDGVSFNFIECPCAFEHTWMMAIIARETMCIIFFWVIMHTKAQGKMCDHMHLSVPKWLCALIFFCLHWHFLACHWCLCACRIW